MEPTPVSKGLWEEGPRPLEQRHWGGCGTQGVPFPTQVLHSRSCHRGRGPEDPVLASCHLPEVDIGEEEEQHQRGHDQPAVDKLDEETGGMTTWCPGIPFPPESTNVPLLLAKLGRVKDEGRAVPKASPLAAISGTAVTLLLVSPP